MIFNELVENIYHSESYTFTFLHMAVGCVVNCRLHWELVDIAFNTLFFGLINIHTDAICTFKVFRYFIILIEEVLVALIKMANTMAMIGALKMAATAAVEPQASKSVVLLALRLNNRATLEPIAEPVNTIGASSPTEPPKPTVSVLATIEEYILWRRNLPSLLKIDFNRIQTPCRIWSLITLRV